MSESSDNTTLYSDMTILCVDDERVILRTLQRLFHRKSYKVLIANSGQDALDIIKDTPIDVVVSDMRMPEMDGATLLEKIANTHPDTYRIVLSGFADFESTVAAINLGKTHRFINKPWDNDGLINAVEEGLEIIRLTKENKNLKDKIEKQNELLKGLNNNLEEKVNLRTKQIRASLLKNEVNIRAGEKMLFNFIAINPTLSGGYAKKVGQLAGRLAEELCLEKQAVHNIRIAGYLNEMGLLGMNSSFSKTPFNQLNSESKKQFMSQGVIVQQILSPAPCLNVVKQILAYQYYSLKTIAEKTDDAIFTACKILIVARDYWRFHCGKIDANKMVHKQILVQLNKGKGIKYAENILEILTAKPEIVVDYVNLEGLSTRKLISGMILKNSLFSINNLLILAEGHEFTENSINKLIEYEANQKQKFVVTVES